MKQLTIFDFIECNDPCADCLFWDGKCTHEVWEDARCEDGSFRVKRELGICPDCGKQMRINQQPFGSDVGYCPNGAVGRIFNNQGNRLGWLEAWKKGMVQVK